MDSSHVVVRNRADGRYELECKHCTEALIPGLPIAIDEFVKVMKDFERKHKDCLPVIYKASTRGTI